MVLFVLWRHNDKVLLHSLVGESDQSVASTLGSQRYTGGHEVLKVTAKVAAPSLDFWNLVPVFPKGSFQAGNAAVPACVEFSLQICPYHLVQWIYMV